MNRIQYKRWKDFATRMAERGQPARITGNRHYKAIVPQAVEHFFEWMEGCYRDDVIRIESWDDTRTDYRNAQEFNWGFRGITSPYVCDIASDLVQEYNPYYWPGPNYKYEKWDELWGGRIHCCLRAGLDLAANPSAGVVGFCKEDIERMYPDGVPKWISNGWEKKNGDWKSVLWEDLPPDAGLWS